MYDIHFKCSFLERRVWQKLPGCTLFPTHFRIKGTAFSLRKESQAPLALGNDFPCVSVLEQSYQDSSILYYKRGASYHIPRLLQERNSISQEHIGERRKRGTYMPSISASGETRQDCIGAVERRPASAVGEPHSRGKFCIIGEIINKSLFLSAKKDPAGLTHELLRLRSHSSLVHQLLRHSGPV